LDAEKKAVFVSFQARESLPMLADNAAFVQRPKQLRPFEAMLLVHRT
jgi:hypothetical protein